MQNVELSNGLPGREKRKLLGLLAAGILILAALMLAPYGAPSDWPLGKLAEALLPPYEKSFSATSMILAVCLLLSVYMSLIWRGARLIIGPEGIAHDPGLPRWLSFVNAGWRYRWDEVTLRPAVERIVVPGQAWLIVDAGDRQHRLQMLVWHRADGKTYETADEPRNSALLFMSTARSTEVALKRSPLLNTLAEFGVSMVAAGRQKDSLERVKGAMVLVYITISGLALGILGMIFPFEKFVFGIPWRIVISLGVTATAVALFAVFKWMRALNVGEKLFLPVLVGGAVGFVSIPGLEVVNAVTASEPMRTIAFEQQPDLALLPLNQPDVPELRISEHSWYWLEFDTGQIHEIRVRKGGLGLWAYDYRDYQQQVRERDRTVIARVNTAESGTVQTRTFTSSGLRSLR